MKYIGRRNQSSLFPQQQALNEEYVEKVGPYIEKVKAINA